MLNESSDITTPLGYNSPTHLRHYMAASSGVFKLYDKPCIFRPYDGKVFTINTESKSLNPLLDWDMGMKTLLSTTLKIILLRFAVLVEQVSRFLRLLSLRETFTHWYII